MNDRIGIAIVAIALAAPVHAQTNLTELSAAEAAEEIRAGKLKSEDLVKALADVIDKKKDLGAFIAFDREAALKAARESDALAAKKKFKGTAARRADRRQGQHPRRRLREHRGNAGASRLQAESRRTRGEQADSRRRDRARQDEHARARIRHHIEQRCVWPGTQRYDPKRIAGGSSGGTANAIAARMAPAGLGSDTGGSVRIPAALNGIAGLRPTLKRYSQEGITPIAHTRDTAGPMARTVEDLVLLDNVIAGASDTVAPAALKGMRIGVHKAYFFNGLDAETEKLTLAALDKIKAAGAEIVEVDMPGLADLNGKVSFPVALFEANTDLAAYLKKFNIPLDVKGVAAQIKSPDVKGVFEGVIVPGAPKPMPPEAYKAALQTRPKLQKLYADTFAKNKIAALAFSDHAAAGRADRRRRKEPSSTARTCRRSRHSSRTPTRQQCRDPWPDDPDRAHAGGLPIGLELDGPAGSDRKLLALGLALEKVFGRLPAP
jgi:mandelamide amidase